MVKLNKSNNIRNKTRLLLLISIIINIYKIDKRIQVKFIWKTIASLVSLSQGKFGLDYHDWIVGVKGQSKPVQDNVRIYTPLSILYPRSVDEISKNGSHFVSLT